MVYNKFNSKIAEFVGIMLGDGYINYPKQPRIKITLNSVADKEYLHFINDLITTNFRTKAIIKHRKNENASDIFLFNRKIIRFVINDFKLIPSPKWGRATIPNWIFEKNLEKFVLRGYFDTDGCVVITNSDERNKSIEEME